jgi:hypothetical protein
MYRSGFFVQILQMHAYGVTALHGLEPTGEAIGRDKVVEVAVRQVPVISQAFLCNSKQEANNRAD